MEKTFKEVLNNIKEGEIWENDYRKIELVNGGVRIKHKKNHKATREMFSDEKTKYKLKG